MRINQEEIEVIEINDSTATIDGTAVGDESGKLDEVHDDPLEDPNYIPDNQQDTAAGTHPTPYQTRSKTKVHPFQLNNLALFVEPSNVKEAQNDQQSVKWKSAMDDEINSHDVSNSWTLTKLPANRKAIKAKWDNDDENLIRYKARLVAKGYVQREGIDYVETFSCGSLFVDSISDCLGS